MIRFLTTSVIKRIATKKYSVLRLLSQLVCMQAREKVPYNFEQNIVASTTFLEVDSIKPHPTRIT